MHGATIKTTKTLRTKGRIAALKQKHTTKSINSLISYTIIFCPIWGNCTSHNIYWEPFLGLEKRQPFCYLHISQFLHYFDDKTGRICSKILFVTKHNGSVTLNAILVLW